MNLEKLQNNSGPIKGQHDRTEFNLKLRHTDSTAQLKWDMGEQI